MFDVLILAAGMGTRLKPLTHNLPKCLVKFQKQSLIDYQLSHFLNNKEVNQIYIAAGFKAKLIKQKFLNNSKITIINIKDFKKKNMLHSFITSLKFIKSKKPLVVSYGDIIYNNHVLKKILRSTENISTIYLKNFFDLWKLRLKKNYLKDLETFRINSKKVLLKIGNKLPKETDLDGQYIGLTKIKGTYKKKLIKIYELDKKKFLLEKKDITFFFSRLIAKSFKIVCVPINKGFLEFDTYDDWKIYNRCVKIHKMDHFFNLNEFNN